MQPTTSAKGTPIPVIHQKTAGGATGGSDQDKAEVAALKTRIDQLSKQRQDEIRAYEENDRQLADVTLQVTTLKKQHADQSTLLASCRDTLADVKAKYDSSAASWTAEKDLLQKTIRQVRYCPILRKLSIFQSADVDYATMQVVIIAIEVINVHDKWTIFD